MGQDKGFQNETNKVKNDRLTRRDFGKTVSAGTLGLVGTAWANGCRPAEVNNRFSIIIKNGTIFDGGGGAPFKSDIGISGDRIAAIDNLGEATADTIIDAENLAVSPGFIDIHTHTDIGLLVNNKAESKIMQGVTTEVGGQCGSSVFPLNEEALKWLDENTFEKFEIHVDWQDLDGFLQRIEAGKTSINYATFTGHGDIRGQVVGRNDVKATPEQLKKMKDILKLTMEQGSFGLSSGLEYAPSSYADTEEMVELCRVVSGNGGVYATHIRNENDKVEESIEEALETCRRAEVSLQVSHLKANNPDNWHKLDHVLEMLGNALDSGLPVNADRYPYIAYSTGLPIFFPLWALQGTLEEKLARFNDPKQYPKIMKAVAKNGENIGGWDRVVISSCFLEENKKWEGRPISECAEQAGKDPLEFIRTLLIEEKNQVQIVGFGMNEDNLKKVLASSFVMVGSDGNAVAPHGKLGMGKPHPRYYGTFPRVLGKYAREERIFDLATSVKKMTSMPAGKLGFSGRGSLAANNYADIVVFNPDTVIDKATFVDPHQFAFGIDHVIVNGQVTVRNGEHTGITAGAVLRH